MLLPLIGLASFLLCFIKFMKAVSAAGEIGLHIVVVAPFSSSLVYHGMSGKAGYDGGLR